MTVQEAIKKNISECKRRIFIIKDFLKNSKDAHVDECKENIFMLETTIQALEEVEQYRALGTVEELKEASGFKKYFDDLYGEGLEVANWHKNGDLEPFDSFYESALDWSEEDD